MGWAEFQDIAIGLLTGLGATSAFLLLLFIGFCVVFGLPKLIATKRASTVHRSLDEMVGAPIVYLTPQSPRGQVDQLRTPELLEASGRNNG